MKYPITADADVVALRRVRLPAITLADLWGAFASHWGVVAALALTFAIHAPTLRYYFDGDDFVVLGSIEHFGNAGYLRDTVLLRDIVPNWRPLTAAVYTLEWDLFGLNPTAWRSVNLGVHLVSVALLYALVLRATRRPAAGAVAAVVFGVSGSHFDTVTYVTALPHVLATCFTLGSLLAVVAYAQSNERRPTLFWLSFALFALAFLANEGSFVYAPLIAGAYALFAVRWRRAPLRLVLHALPFAVVAVGWSVFYEAFPNEQLRFDGYGWGPHVARNYAVYLSYIALPTRAIPLEPGTWRTLLALAMVAGGAVLAWRGPQLARVAVAGVAIALLPFVPVEIWTASRYTYAAVAFFGIGAGIAGVALYDRVASLHRRLRAPAMAFGIAAVAVVAGLYSWQTHARNARSGEGTARWQLLVDELRANYASVPPGTTIWIVDGPWTNPMEQYTWVPSVARAVYGDAAAFDLPRSAYVQEPPRADGALFLEWTDGGLRPVPAEWVVSR